MKAIRILTALFVLSSLVSQSALDFFSVLVCGQWVYYVWQSKKAEEPRPFLRSFGLEKLWAFWLAVVVIGFLLNFRDPFYMIPRILEFKWILILYALVEVFHLIQPSRKDLRFHLGLFLFIGISNLLIAEVNSPLWANLQYEGGPNHLIRAGGFLANPMTFAHLFSLFFCFLAGVFVVDRSNWTKLQKIIGALCLIIGAVGLFLTFTRGVWISLLVAGLLGLFIWKYKYGLIFLIGMAGSSALLYKYSEGFQWRVDRSMAEVTGVSERKYIWNANMEIFKDHPWFGAGYGQNTMVLPEYYKKLGIPEKTLQSHAHNQLLHLAAGTGILGLISYLLVWLFFFEQLRNLWGSDLDSWDRGAVLGFFMAQVSFLVSGLTEANFEHSKVRFGVIFIWASIVYLARKYGTLPGLQRKTNE